MKEKLLRSNENEDPSAAEERRLLKELEIRQLSKEVKPSPA
jgi:hypothetical protein